MHSSRMRTVCCSGGGKGYAMEVSDMGVSFGGGGSAGGVCLEWGFYLGGVCQGVSA